jgi:hypothetical protein
MENDTGYRSFYKESDFLVPAESPKVLHWQRRRPHLPIAAGSERLGFGSSTPSPAHLHTLDGRGGPPAAQPGGTIGEQNLFPEIQLQEPASPLLNVQ